MKNKLFLFICVIWFTMTCSNVTAQIKMHDDGHLSFQSFTKNFGVQVDPVGRTSFEPNLNLSYSRLVKAKTFHQLCKTWIVQYAGTLQNGYGDYYYVTGFGDVYYNHEYQIQFGNDTKGHYPIEKPSEMLSSLNGYYYDYDEYEGFEPDFIDNPNVKPEAVEGLMKDLEIDKSLGLDAETMELVLPEAIRHDPDGRICINYSAVIPVIVEAFKEQQREIEALKELLEENGIKRVRR